MMLNIQELPVPLASREKHDFFHPSPCVLADGLWMMTFHRIQNADCYGGCEVVFSVDEGGTWSASRKVEALRTLAVRKNLMLGVADVRPFPSQDGEKALLIGCDTIYTSRGNASWDKDAPEPPPLRYGSYYTIFDARKRVFGPRRMLRNPALPPEKLWRVACAQATYAPDGDWILPAYFEHRANVEYEAGYFSPRFAVETVKVHLEGDTLIPVAWGTQLVYENMRGFLEPSLIRGTRDYLLTIRAEDGCAYVSRGMDGLQWPQPVPWRFDDGALLETDSTQQHWMMAGGKLHLVYTRKSAESASAMRYRSILFVAEVDETQEVPVLKRNTEQELYPRRQREGIDGLLGNFHVANLPDGTALVGDAYGFYKVENDDIVERYNDVVLKRVSLNSK